MTEFKNVDFEGDLFTIEEWNNHVRNGLFVPDDGSGFWADATRHVDIGDPFDSSTKPDWATHVMWFNK